MDSIDNLSDTSNLSDISECLSSNASTVSDLSVYQGEYLQLQQLINPKQHVRVPEKKVEHLKHQVNNISVYEEHIKNLTSQLQTLLHENEEHKNSISDVKQKSEISNNAQIEKLLKQNRQLEINLENANNQIRRLIKNYAIKNEKSKIYLLENKIVELEKSNQKLNSENSLLSNEVNHIRYCKNGMELENENLKSQFSDFKLELITKSNCITELKEKISQQYVEIQALTQNNIKLSHSLESVSNDVRFIRKSEEWYKNQLHQCQEEKVNLIKQISENKQAMVSHEKQIEELKLELSKLKCKYDEACITTLKDKETFLRKLETVNRTVLKTENNNNNVNMQLDVERITRYYEANIYDLTSEVAMIKQNFEEQQNSFKNLSKEYADTLSKYLLLQKTVQEQTIFIDELENSKSDLKQKLSVFTEKEKTSNAEMSNLRNKVVELQIELSSKNYEKENVEITIGTIKEQFKILKNNYDRLKEELNNKNKELLQLQVEKQELFMKCNWKTCEMEDVKGKNLKIRNLEERIGALLITEKTLKAENSKLLQDLSNKNSELDGKCHEYENCSDNYKEIINELNDSMKKKDEQIVDLKDSINILKEELHKRDSFVFLRDSEIKNKSVANYILDNCANSRSLPNIESTDVLDFINYICVLCEIESNIFLEKSNNKTDYIKLLLDEINLYFKKVKNECNTKNKTVKRLKNNTLGEIEKLKHRCKELEKKSEENSNIVLSVLANAENNENEKIRHLQALLQVKIREQKEKQKRYEINYRTLLRKVKEHMRGRNAAEKHNLYLQELYNNVSNEHNMLKLQFSIKVSEIKSLQDSLETYISANEKLKSKLLNLESESKNSSQCNRCIELDIVMKQMREVEEQFRNSEEYKLKCLDKLKESQECIHNLRTENQELLFKISAIENEHCCSINRISILNKNIKEISDKLNEVDKLLIQEKLVSDHLKTQLFKEKETISDIIMEKEDLNKRLQETCEKNRYLQREVEISSSTLRQKCKEFDYLENQKAQLEKGCLEKDKEMQRLLFILKNELELNRNELNTFKSEKFFLQRLCSDLKIALKVHANHNKVYKEYFDSWKEKHEFDSLPSVLVEFPSPSKYDDNYINKLLQENKMPLQDKPLGDIQDCLDTLRKEITVLQKQIVEKNVSVNSF